MQRRLLAGFASRFSPLYRRVRSSSLVKNSSFYALNLLSQIVFQLGYFVLISRAFGPSGYGIFASLSAVSLLIAVFVGWGSERVLIQKVAVAPETFRTLFGNALVLQALTVLPLGLFAFLVLSLLEHGSMSATGLAFIVIAELVFRRLTMLSLCCFFAHEKAVKHLVLDLCTHFMRLAFAFMATVFSDPLTLDVWAMWYVTGSAIAAVCALTFAAVDLGLPRLNLEKPDLRLGFLYSLELGSMAGLRDLDKPVIVETLGAAAGGIYIAAFRIISAAASPLRGVLFATYTHYFRHAEKSIKQGISFGLRVLPYVGGVAIAVAGCLFIGAGFLPWILGEEYREVVPLVRIMAVYPLLIGAFGVGSDLLRAIGLQGVRVLLIGIALFSVIPVAWIGATYGGLQGAVAARMALELVIVIATWRIVQRKHDGAQNVPQGDQ